MRSKPVIIFVANRGYALSSSRRNLIARLVRDGWTVVIATRDDDEARALEALGVSRETVIFDRRGFSPRADLRSFRQLLRIYRKWRPDVIHHFHAKPLVFGSLAARLVMGKRVGIVNTVTGLGHAFITGGIAASMAAAGYRLTQRLADLVVFQNQDDKELFLERKWVRENRARLILGSGVNLERFTRSVPRTSTDAGNPLVVMLGRLLAQKGTHEFAEVARRVHETGMEARFAWAGEEDPDHPDAVTAAWMRQQQHLEYLGHLADVLPLLSEADLLLFPSYREGIPRTILEAAALEVPTVAFDVPGVRQAVVNGETGLLAPFGDVDCLSRHTLDLLRDDEKRRLLGRQARGLMENVFDIRQVERAYLQIYKALIPAGAVPRSLPGTD